ncbi:MAG: InlB B-repeat-containing protein, partial [Ruminococcus sp.]|nr:InlB B-repeat-containing protein [Ruminococcus sp.]
MKKLLNKFTAVISVYAIALCSFSSTVSAEDTDNNSEITITFDYMSDGATVKDESVFAPITVNAGSSIEIPEGTLSRDGYFFSGWTCDDIHAYIEGDVFRSPDGKDVTLRPIWGEKNQEATYEVKYVVEIDGEILDTSKELKTISYSSGQVATISLMSYSRNDATQFGWSDGTTAFSGQEKIIIHDHDITLTPN